LESVGPRPRQARYQAALRPDMKYVMIIKHFPTEMLLHQSKFGLHGVNPSVGYCLNLFKTLPSVETVSHCRLYVDGAAKWNGEEVYRLR